MQLTEEINPEINLEEYLNLAYHNAIKFQRITDLEFDDVLGICNLALVLAKRTFKPELGYKFTTYATKAMWGQIMNERNRRKSPKALHLEDIVKEYKDLDWESAFADNCDYEDMVLTKINFEEVVKKLTPRQQEALKIQMENPGLLKKQHAKMMGITYVRLRQINANIKKQLAM